MTTDVADTHSDAPLSERIEQSPWGRLAIGAAIVLIIATTVGTHLPASDLAQTVSPRSNEIIRLFGVEQSWGVFAPDPRSTSLGIEGRVTFADGGEAVWTLPSGSRLVGNLRYYRWRKWLERVRSDEYSSTWEPTARWIASLYDDRDSPVVKVELVRFFRENSILNPQPPYDQYTYFTLDVDEDSP